MLCNNVNNLRYIPQTFVSFCVLLFHITAYYRPVTTAVKRTWEQVCEVPSSQRAVLKKHSFQDSSGPNSAPAKVHLLPAGVLSSSFPTLRHSLKVRPPPLSTQSDIDRSSPSIPCPSLASDIASLQKMGEHYVWISVSESSRSTYQTGFRRWQKFVIWLGTDIMMDKIPPEWTAACNRPGYVAQPWYESCVAAFLCWMRNVGNVVEPKTAFNYLAGVSHYLQNYGMNTEFLRSPFLKATKNGMLNEWAALPGNSTAERKRIPISIDMIMAVYDSFPRPLSLENITVHTAMIFAFITASRISEYLPASSATLGHAILSEHVVFTVNSGPFAGQHLPSFRCHDISLKDISAVFIFIRNAKNEQEGKGNRISYTKGTVSKARVFDAVSVLWSYTTRAKPVLNAPFFMVTVAGNSTWTLCRPTFNVRLKEIAELFGLDPTRVVSHGLRGGLASTLAVAQVPAHVYHSLGGWSSECYTTYQTATTTVYDDIHKILADPKVLTVQDIKLSTCSNLLNVSGLQPSSFLPATVFSRRVDRETKPVSTESSPSHSNDRKDLITSSARIITKPSRFL